MGLWEQPTTIQRDIEIYRIHYERIYLVDCALVDEPMKAEKV